MWNPVYCLIDGQELIVMRYKQLALLCALLALYPVTSGANVFSQLSVSIGNESNVPRGLDADHEVESQFMQLGFSGGKFLQLGLNDSLTLSSSVTANHYRKTSGFDNYALGGQAEYLHKFGFGAYAPRLGFSVGANRNFMAGRVRDSFGKTAQLILSKRFTPAFMLRVGIDYEDIDSPTVEADAATLSFGYDPRFRLPFELFSYHSKAAFIDGEYAIANGWLLEGRLRRIDGGTVSSTTQPSLPLYKRARAFYSDPGFDSGWFAYLLDAMTNEWSAGLSVPMGTDTSINLRATWHDSKSSADGSYENSIVTVGYVRNF